MIKENKCLDALAALPEVLGAFLCNSSGAVLASKMPEYLALDQVEKAAKLLSQQRAAASAAVGDVQRCEFRYLEYKFFVYYLPEGTLFVLCRPKANAQRIDFEIELFRDELKAILEGGNAVSPQEPRAESQPEAVAPVVKNEPKSEKNNTFLLVAVACLVLLAVAGGAFFYLSNSPRPQPAVVTNQPSQSAKPQQTAPAAAPAVQAQPEPATPAAAPVKTEVVLRIEGSETIGHQLAPEIAMAFMTKEMYAGDVQLVKDGKNSSQRVEATLGDGRHVAIEFIPSGSNGAFTCLEQGRCDIGMSSRPISSTELAKLESIGPMNSPASEHILALDGIAVVLHSVNGLDVLSKQQIADIFTGKIASWEQLPGSGLKGAINLYGRSMASGTGRIFSRLALDGQELAGAMNIVARDQDVADKVAGDTNAIGFVSMPYIAKAKAVAISQEEAGSVYPTPFTIATEDYPLARRLYFYTAVNPKNYLTRPFVQFALGDAGQAAADASGFVKLTIDKIKPPIPDTAPEEYRQAVANASRLSLNFRFKSGSSELDNRGRRDLERLVNFLTMPENRNKSIRLLGFADSRGERKANCYLSEVRADKVATILQWRGIKTEIVKGFCEDMPIASNTTALGRDKNRRVEVWLGE